MPRPSWASRQPRQPRPPPFRQPLSSRALSLPGGLVSRVFRLFGGRFLRGRFLRGGLLHRLPGGLVSRVFRLFGGRFLCGRFLRSRLLRRLPGGLRLHRLPGLDGLFFHDSGFFRSSFLSWHNNLLLLDGPSGQQLSIRSSGKSHLPVFIIAFGPEKSISSAKIPHNRALFVDYDRVIGSFLPS